MAKIALDLVTRGWELPGWEGTFYPEDLPADWRLTYFANEFPAVLIPCDLWAAANDAANDIGLRAWSADVHEGFRFYLEEGWDEGGDEGPHDPGSGLGAKERAAALLGAKLAGSVSAAGIGPVPAGGWTRFELLTRPGASPRTGNLPAWSIPPALGDDLRAARAWLEALAACPGPARGLLILGGRPDAEDLRRWWDLLWLLGMAVA